jgi:hypothetical protein
MSDCLVREFEPGAQLRASCCSELRRDCLSSARIDMGNPGGLDRGRILIAAPESLPRRLKQLDGFGLIIGKRELLGVCWAQCLHA